MTEIDTLTQLADAVPGVWTHEHVTVQRVTVQRRSHATLSIVVAGADILVEHGFGPEDLSEGLVSRVTEQIGRAGLSQENFELVMVGLVRSTLDDPVAAWTRYYRNSLDQLMDGSADFAPIHERAQQLVVGSVLDLGSCFGFFPLRLAMNGTAVIATDLSQGTMTLLSRVAPEFGVAMTTLVCNAAQIPLPDSSVDTVTALHLLEHVDAETGLAIIGEALRIARRRVVVAVPYEQQATACHGHVRTFDADALRHIGFGSGRAFQVTEYHGGWLVLEVTD